MSVMEKKNSDFSSEEVNEAVWEEKRKRISSVWVVPIVALIVGAWLIFHTISSKGPVIEITFKSAEGVKAGKTIIKYKDIEVGKVTNVVFSKDLSKVIVTAEMTKNMRPFLSENTRFWIMKARISLNHVEGLDTLLSGVYIVMDPKQGDTRTKEFKGLDSIPVVSMDENVSRYILRAKDMGSIEVGSPIYYKKLNAGSVSAYHLSPDGKDINIEVFIKAPYNKLITNHTRFWNTSGVSASFSANGVEIHTESLTAILAGGLAFDNIEQEGEREKAKEQHEFILYKSVKDAREVHYSRELFFRLHFQGSIRGLSIGAPVEFRGVKIGEVVNFSLIGNADDAHFEIPILIKVEPERFRIFPKGSKNDYEPDVEILQKLIKKGFRAQLKSGNLLTGEIFVDMSMHQDVPLAQLTKEDGFYVIPTVPATIESLKSDIKTLLDRLAAVPFEEIGEELQMAIKDLRTGTIPTLDATLQSTNKMMKGANSSIQALQQNYLDSDAEVNKKMIKLLEELTRTSRSIKKLTDYLERHPDSLIKGK